MNSPRTTQVEYTYDLSKPKNAEYTRLADIVTVVCGMASIVYGTYHIFSLDKNDVCVAVFSVTFRVRHHRYITSLFKNAFLYARACFAFVG